MARCMPLDWAKSRHTPGHSRSASPFIILMTRGRISSYSVGGIRLRNSWYRLRSARSEGSSSRTPSVRKSNPWTFPIWVELPSITKSRSRRVWIRSPSSAHARVRLNRRMNEGRMRGVRSKAICSETIGPIRHGSPDRSFRVCYSKLEAMASASSAIRFGSGSLILWEKFISPSCWSGTRWIWA